jgi:2-methylcitrate dehydratase PrpD
MTNPALLDLSELFARCVAATRYEDLPAAAIDTAKKSLLDTLGVMLAASGAEPAVRPFLDLVMESGGTPESTIVGIGRRVPAAAAALANGAMAHCLDFDDRTARGGHAASSMVPAVLALAERKGGISGKTFIQAIAAGQDMFVRLRCNVGANPLWNVSTVLGVFSATAAAAVILALRQEQIASALSIASMQAGGTMQPIYGGTHLRGMYAGFSANAAVNAALLAERGMSGIAGVFEGKAGVLNACFGGEFDRQAILANLGDEHLGADMVYKPWPVVGLSHTYIHAVLQVMDEQSLEPDDVEEIRVLVNEVQHQMCTPLEQRRSPQSAVEARFSLPYIVALAATKRRVGMKDFAPEALQDAKVVAMAQRVVPVEETSEAGNSPSLVGRVVVSTRDGRRFERAGENAPGSPGAPMTWEQLAAKFRGCASAAASPISESNIESLVGLVRRLEYLEDAGGILGALA